MSEQPLKQSEIITIPAPLYGIATGTRHALSQGYADEVFNFIPVKRGKRYGLKTMLGWKTIADGFEDNGSYPGAASGGINHTSYYKWVDYCKNDSGKVKVFQRSGFCDTATGDQFASATTSTFARQDSKDWLGCFAFAGAFFAYNELKLYSITMADGSLTAEITFSDLGSDYSPILKIIERFGQLWVITQKDRIFWGDVNKYSYANGSAVTAYPLAKDWVHWQMLDHAQLASIQKVEYLGIQEWDIRHAKANDIVYGSAITYLKGEPAELSNGDVIYPEGYSIKRTVSTSVAVTFTLSDAATAGDGWILINKDATNKEHRLIGKTDWQHIQIADGSNSETHKVTNINFQSGKVALTIGELANSFATGDTTVTLLHSMKVTVSASWDLTIEHAKMLSDAWTTLPAENYDSNLDPNNDDTVSGHIKLNDTELVRSADGFRIDFTPKTNAYNSGASGWMNVCRQAGNIVEVAEGADYQEDQGTSVLYIFKDDGRIYAVVGKPGVYGDEGTLDIRFITEGIKARSGTARTTQMGVFFGALEGIDYSVYFIPHSAVTRGVGNMVNLAEHYDFNNDIPFDDSTKELYEVTAVYKNMYFIAFPYAANDTTLPTTNGFTYICKVHQEEGDILGSWFRMPDSTKEEYEDDGDTVASGGEPTTTGYYIHNGQLYKVYYLKTGHDFAGNTRYYEIARYGWRDAGEECKSKYVFTKDNGDGTYTSEFNTSYFYAKIKYPMMSWGKALDIMRLLFSVDCVGGSDGDGIDVTLNIYKDLSYSSAISGCPHSIADLTDKTGEQNLLTELRHETLHFSVDRYVQFELIFDNIKYDSYPAYVLFMGMAMEAGYLPDRGLLSQEFHGS